MITVTVKTLDSQSRDFNVPDDFTVRQFKDHIADTVLIPADVQRLIYLGRVLQNDTKLADAGVNGKALHLVERAPPTSAEVEDTIGQNASVNQSRLETRRLDPGSGSGAMYLGAMAFPADLMESQGISVPPPRQGFTSSRIAMARVMLGRAQTTIGRLERSDLLRRIPDYPSTAFNTFPDGSDMNTSSSDGGENATSNEPPDNEMQVDEQDDANVEGEEEERINMQDDDSGIQVVIGPSAQNITAVVNEPPEDTEDIVNDDGNDTGNNDGNNGNDGTNGAQLTGLPEPTPGGTGRRRYRSGRSHNIRTPAMAAVLEIMARTQRRLWPFLRAMHYLLSADPVFNTMSELSAGQAQYLFNSVSEVMHDLSHAYHCLSDIMCDFNTQPQRALRCRPVLIQHSAVLHTGMLPANRLTGVNFRNPVRSGRTAPQNPGNAQLTTNASDTSTPNASDAARREQQLIAAIPVGENEIPAIVIEEEVEINGTLDTENNAPLPGFVVELQPAFQIDSVEATIVTSGDSARPTFTTTGPIRVGQNFSPNMIRGMITLVSDHIRRQHTPPGAETPAVQGDGVQTVTEQSAILPEQHVNRNTTYSPGTGIVETSTVLPRTQVTCIEINTLPPEQMDQIPFLFPQTSNLPTATDDSESAVEETAAAAAPTTVPDNNDQTSVDAIATQSTAEIDDNQDDIMRATTDDSGNDEMPQTQNADQEESRRSSSVSNRQSPNGNSGGGGRPAPRVRRYTPHVLLHRQRARQSQQQSASQPTSTSITTTTSSSTSSTFTTSANSFPARIRRVPIPPGFDMPSFTRSFDPFLPCNSHHIQSSRTGSSRRARNGGLSTTSSTTASGVPAAPIVTATNGFARIPLSMLYTGSNFDRPFQFSAPLISGGQPQQQQQQQQDQQQARNVAGFFSSSTTTTTVTTTTTTATSTASATSATTTVPTATSNYTTITAEQAESSGLMRVVNSILSNLTASPTPIPITAITPGGYPYTILERMPFGNASSTGRHAEAGSAAEGAANPPTGAPVTSTTASATTASATSTTSSTQTTQRTAAGTQTAESVLRERARRLEGNRAAQASAVVQNIADLAAAFTVLTGGSIQQTTNPNVAGSANTEQPQEARTPNEPNQPTANESKTNNSSSVSGGGSSEGTSSPESGEVPLIPQRISMGAPLFDESLGSWFMDFIQAILRGMPFSQIVELHSTDTRRLCINFRRLFKQYLVYHFYPSGFNKCLATDVVNKMFNNHVATLRNILDSADIRSDIDLVSTICQFNHMNIPDILAFIMSSENDDAFVIRFPRMMRLYLGQLATLIKSCLVNNDANLKKLITLLVNNSEQNLPADPILLAWLRENLPEHIISYESRPVSDLPRFMKDYIVFRLPDAIDLPNLPEDISSSSPMAVDNLDDLHFEDAVNGDVGDTVVENGLVGDGNGVNQNSDEDKDDNATAGEQLPNLLIEQEPWHSSVPADWVPIITRDVQKLRRQGSQPPFSDAYLSGMPSKRRKLLSGTNEEVSNSVEKVIADGTVSDRNTNSEED